MLSQKYLISNISNNNNNNNNNGNPLKATYMDVVIIISSFE